jgi:hypothetical protein
MVAHDHHHSLLPSPAPQAQTGICIIVAGRIGPQRTNSLTAPRDSEDDLGAPRDQDLGRLVVGVRA